MALSKTVSQVCVLLTTLVSVVFPQQGQPQAGTDPNAFSNFGTSNPGTDMGAGMSFGTPGVQNSGFPAGLSGGQFPRGFPSSFPTASMGGMNAAPAPLPRPSMAQSLMPLMLMRGSDMAQAMAMATMFGGGGGSSGMISNPLFMLSMMNNM